MAGQSECWSELEKLREKGAGKGWHEWWQFALNRNCWLLLHKWGRSTQQVVEPVGWRPLKLAFLSREEPWCTLGCGWQGFLEAAFSQAELLFLAGAVSPFQAAVTGFPLTPFVPTPSACWTCWLFFFLLSWERHLAINYPSLLVLQMKKGDTQDKWCAFPKAETEMESGTPAFWIPQWCLRLSDIQGVGEKNHESEF